MSRGSSGSSGSREPTIIAFHRLTLRTRILFSSAVRSLQDGAARHQGVHLVHVDEVLQSQQRPSLVLVRRWATLASFSFRPFLCFFFFFLSLFFIPFLTSRTSESPLVKRVSRRSKLYDVSDVSKTRVFLSGGRERRQRNERANYVQKVHFHRAIEDPASWLVPISFNTRITKMVKIWIFLGIRTIPQRKTHRWKLARWYNIVKNYKEFPVSFTFYSFNVSGGNFTLWLH